MLQLNYFDCRGRVQAIRNYLHERDIPFVDNRVSVSDGLQEWMAKSQDKNFAGDLGLLPTLRKDGVVISETLVIAYELEPQMTLQDRMLISSMYNDVIVNVGMLIWAEFAFPGTDTKAAAEIMFGRMQQRFYRYEESALPGRNERFFSLSQHFLGESIDAARYVFGTKFAQVMQKSPRLTKFDARYQELASRFERPSQFTGRPNEAQAIKLNFPDYMA